MLWVDEPALERAFHHKEVLITGGLGFLGSNLAHALLALGAKVTLLDALLPLYGGNPFNVASIAGAVEVVSGDIRDEKLVAKLVAGKDYIFDFAAQVSYIDSLLQPFLDLDINCRGRLNVLEACRLHALGAKILFPSSRLVYGRIQRPVVTEDHPTEPLSLYGVHKLAAEKYLRIYHDAYGLHYCVLRLPNPYGPRQQLKHSKYSIVGWFIHLAMAGKTIQVFGDGSQVRDYIYVDDVTRAFLLVAASARTDGQVYNIGSPQTVSFAEMVDTVLRIVGKGQKEFVPWPPNYERNETGDYRASTEKVLRDVGWTPRVSLTEGIQRTYQYYLEHGMHYRKEGGEAQILAYRGVTPRELAARLGELRLPGEGFADDLEAIQAAQPKTGTPAWPS